jgi:hypothetical protein
MAIGDGNSLGFEGPSRLCFYLGSFRYEDNQSSLYAAGVLRLQERSRRKLKSSRNYVSSIIGVGSYGVASLESMKW